MDTTYCCYTFPDGDPECCDNIIDDWLWNDMIAPDYQACFKNVIDIVLINFFQGNFCRCEDITNSVAFNQCFEGTVGKK